MKWTLSTKDNPTSNKVQVCSAVYAGSLPNMEYAVEELVEISSPPVRLARAIHVCICMDLPYIPIWNTPALGLLLKHGEVDGDVAEAAAAIQSILSSSADLGLELVY